LSSLQQAKVREIGDKSLTQRRPSENMRRPQIAYFAPSKSVRDTRMHYGACMQGRTWSTEQSRIVAAGPNDSAREADPRRRPRFQWVHLRKAFREQRQTQCKRLVRKMFQEAGLDGLGEGRTASVAEKGNSTGSSQPQHPGKFCLLEIHEEACMTGARPGI
jgi:hypothetical protein